MLLLVGLFIPLSFTREYCAWGPVVGMAIFSLYSTGIFPIMALINSLGPIYNIRISITIMGVDVSLICYIEWFY